MGVPQKLSPFVLNLVMTRLAERLADVGGVYPTAFTDVTLLAEAERALLYRPRRHSASGGTDDIGVATIHHGHADVYGRNQLHPL